MCFRQDQENTTIANLTNVKEIFVVNADFCIVKYSTGVCVFNIRKTKCLKLKLKINKSIERDILERDECVIHLAHNINIRILETKITKTDERIIYRIVLHAETLLLIIEISEQRSNQFYEACITTAIHLPGFPTYFCFVSRNAGFLVSWRHEKEIIHKYSRQHLFHFSTEDQLLGTIPFLIIDTWNTFVIRQTRVWSSKDSSVMLESKIFKKAK